MRSLTLALEDVATFFLQLFCKHQWDGRPESICFRCGKFKP